MARSRFNDPIDPIDPMTLGNMRASGVRARNQSAQTRG
jgi:hypothetical protein